MSVIQTEQMAETTKDTKDMNEYNASDMILWLHS